MDVVVRATQESSGYWVRVQGSGACAAVSAKAMLLYSGFNYTSMLLENQVIYLLSNVLLYIKTIG